PAAPDPTTITSYSVSTGIQLQKWISLQFVRSVVERLSCICFENTSASFPLSVLFSVRNGDRAFNERHCPAARTGNEMGHTLLAWVFGSSVACCRFALWQFSKMQLAGPALGGRLGTARYPIVRIAK